MTLQVPYGWLSNQETFFAVAKGEKLPALSIFDNKELYQLIMKCTETLPQNRPTFGQIIELLEAIRQSILNASEALLSSPDSSPSSALASNSKEKRKQHYKLTPADATPLL